MTIYDFQKVVDEQSEKIKNSDISLNNQEIYSYFIQDIVKIFLQNSIDGIQMHEDEDGVKIEIKYEHN